MAAFFTYNDPDGLFFPLSLLPELFIGIAWFIDDPQTLRSFALSHTQAAKAVRKFMLPKKRQFTKMVFGLINRTLYPVLPNGCVHGYFKHVATDTNDVVVKDGVLVWSSHSKLPRQYFFTRNLQFQITSSKTGRRQRVMIATKRRNIIESDRCFRCGTFHVFVGTRNRYFGTLGYIYGRHCDGDKYRALPFPDEWDDVLKARQRLSRPSIAGRVIRYAKKLAVIQNDARGV